MRKKPVEEWHNYAVKDGSEIRCEGNEACALVAWSRPVLQTFMTFASERLKRRSGIRFKLNLNPSFSLREKNFTVRLVGDERPYVYPNESSHTNRFSSFYNRLETYFPQNETPSEVDVALSINEETLPEVLHQLIQINKASPQSGVSFKVKCIRGHAATEVVQKYCGSHVSFELFTRSSVFLSGIKPMVSGSTVVAFVLPIGLSRYLQPDVPHL